MSYRQAAPITDTALPVATTRQVRDAVVALLRRHPRAFGLMLGLHARGGAGRAGRPAAARRDRRGGAGRHDHRPRRPARRGDRRRARGADAADPRGRATGRSVLGEEVLAEIREDFVDDALALPVGHRRVRRQRRPAHPHLPRRRAARLVGALGAAPVADRRGHRACSRSWPRCSVGVWVAIPLLLGAPALAVGLRWYLRRAKDGYLRENASYSDDQRLPDRDRRGCAHRRGARAAGVADRAYATGTSPGRTPRSATRCTCARGSSRPSRWRRTCCPASPRCCSAAGSTAGARSTLGEVTAATLYMQMLVDPLDRVVMILDEFQVGAASLARLLGVAHVPEDRVATGRVPAGEELDGERRAVLLRRRPRRPARGRPVAGASASGWRWSVRPGAGKSTLGRLLAGHPPAADRVGDGRRRRADRAAAGRPARARRAGDPGAPRLRRHGAGEHRAGRRPRGDRRRGDGRARGGRRRRVGAAAARRAGHASSGPVAGRSARPRPSSWRWPGWCSPTRTRWSSTRRRR